MAALRVQELEDEEVQDIIQQLLEQKFKSDDRLLHAVEDCADEQALVDRFISFGFKGALPPPSRKFAHLLDWSDSRARVTSHPTVRQSYLCDLM